MVDDPIQQKRWPEVWRVDHVVSDVDFFKDPWCLVGSVVQHDIAKAQDSPLLIHFVQEALQTPPVCLESGVQFPVIAQRIGRVRATKELQIIFMKTYVPSMIPSTRFAVLPGAITVILTWKLFYFARYWKVGTYRHLVCKNSDHYRPWLWVGLMDQKYYLAWSEWVNGRKFRLEIEKSYSSRKFFKTWEIITWTGVKWIML